MVVYKIVNLGGGVRLDRLSEEISHVVMGDREQSVVTTIQRLNSRSACMDTLVCCYVEVFASTEKTSLAQELQLLSNFLY